MSEREAIEKYQALVDKYSELCGKYADSVNKAIELKARNAELVAALESLSTKARDAITYRPEDITSGGFDLVLSTLELEANAALAKNRGEG